MTDYPDANYDALADAARAQHCQDEQEEAYRARVEAAERALHDVQEELRVARGAAVANGRKHDLVRGALLQVIGLQDGVMIDAQLHEMRKTLKSLAGVQPDNDAMRVSLYAIAVLLGEVE